VGCTVDLAGDLIDEVDCTFAGKSVSALITPPIGDPFYCSVLVADVLPPMIIAPDLMVTCDLDVFSDPPISFGVMADDNCEVDTLFPILCGSVPGDCIDTLKKLKILWQAIDASGNLTGVMQFIAYPVLDFSDVVCPADTTLYCDNADLSGIDAPMIYDSLEFLKNCGLLIEGPKVEEIDLCGPQKWIKRSWTILNTCTWEQDTCMQSIMIADTTGPILTCPDNPADIFIDQASTDCTAPFLLPKVTISHNCAGDETVTSGYEYKGVRYNPNTLIMLDSGINIVTYSATDACWNRTECEITVNVRDNFTLMIECPDDTCVSLEPVDREALKDISQDSLNALFGVPMLVGDLSPCCPFDSFMIDNMYGNLSEPPSEILITRTFTAVDSCGNLSDPCVMTICHENASRQEARVSISTPTKDSDLSMQLAPNPTTAQAFLGLDLPSDQRVKVEITDLTGKVLSSEHHTGSRGFNRFAIDLSGLPSAVLLVRVITSEKEQTQRILKM